MIKLIFYIFKLKLFNPIIILITKFFISVFSERYSSYLIYRIPVNKKIDVIISKSLKFKMNSDGTDSIANLIYWRKGDIKSYENESINLFLKLLLYNHVIFDIGANTGIYSLAAACFSPNNVVHAFEPLNIAYNKLYLNKNLNRFDNIICNNIALGNYDGEAQLESFGYSSLKISTMSTLKKNIWHDLKPNDIFTVKIMKLDTYIKNNNVTKVDLLKIDTEGTENLILVGGNNLIIRDYPTIICEVLAGVIENEIYNFFKDKGYKYFHITKNGLILKENLIGDSKTDRNYLFIHNSKLNEIKDLLFF